MNLKKIKIFMISLLFIFLVACTNIGEADRDLGIPLTEDKFLSRTTIAAEFHSSFVILPDGTLWAWGENGSGQLGDGTTEERLEPVKIMSDVVSVSAGAWHTMAIRTDGSLWAWGNNAHGQLGDGTYNSPNPIIDFSRYSPSPIKIMEDVVAVSAGSAHTMAIRTDGSLWGWGIGRLGDGTNLDRHKPVRIMENVVAVSAGRDHTMAIKVDGSLWVWGWNSSGQLGDGTDVPYLLEPIKIMDDVAFVSAGWDYTMAIRTDGSLWAWGSNWLGQLGNGISTSWLTSNPKPIKIIDDVAFVSAGVGHTMAIKTDGSLWGWGKNTHGQLGDSTVIHRFSPVKIMEGVVSVSAGRYHTMAIGNDGSLWTWGENLELRRGDADENRWLKPTPILTDVTAVSAGSAHNMAVRVDGSLWAWGENVEGQLGDGTQAHRLVPIKIINDVIAVSSGNEHSVAIRTDNSLWAWGSNWRGQLGNGSTAEWFEGTREPIRIMEDVVAVSAGSWHTMAITADGNLWAWGYNRFGKLGDSTVARGSHSPSPIKIMDNVAAVSASVDHTMAIRADGSLWAWGWNSSGQLGDGTTINQLSPIRIMENVVAVSAGRDHTMAIKTDGSLWAWGANWNGQLGNGTYSFEPTTNPVKIMDNVTNVSAGWGYTMVIKADDSLWAWGGNDQGQLGDGKRADMFTQHSPMKIMEDVVAVSSGGQHVMAIRADGNLWGWGNNFSVGAGTIPERIFPTKIMDNVMLP